MINIVIFGGPGSGKGTQSAKIAKKYGLFHISTGDVLRDHIARKTDIGKLAHSYISQGMLIPDKLMIKILEDLMRSRVDDTKNGVIFDGFPRTLAQAQELDVLLTTLDTRIEAVIGLEVPDDELTKRLLLRGQESGRSDDNAEAIRTRLAVYHKQTKPLMEYYKETGRYHSINGVASIDEIFDQICTVIDNANQQ
ncbi:MAG: adenylate kinase [Bacteroidales bacterium]|nr:adenylate kinase [Bacteroidales bacterium]